MFDFDESRAEFKGFSRHYEKEILPFLQRRETERKARIAKAGKHSIGAVILGAGIAVAVFIGSGNPVISILVGSVIGLIGIVISYSVLSSLRGEVKQFLVSNICQFLGWTFTQKGFAQPDLSAWKTHKLLPRSHRQKYEDQMSGAAHGADFQFCEAHLETRHTDSKGRTQWRTSFRGILLQIDFHARFLGTTIVLSDAGIFNAKKKSGMKRVGLEDPVFEKMFEAYGSDQVEARTLLTPTFMQRLVDLKDAMSGKKIQFGFWDEKLFIAVTAPNQFETGSMFETLVAPERVQKTLGEIDAIYGVIDGVIKPLEKHRYS